MTDDHDLGSIVLINHLVRREIADLKAHDWRLSTMIATRDIGAFIADALVKLNFSGKQTREVLGQRDLDMNEATAVIGKAIGKPDLQYVQLPREHERPGLMQMGMSGNMSDLLLEMSDFLNSGHMRALEKRSPENTTPTPFEAFVAETFMPVYKGKSQAV